VLRTPLRLLLAVSILLIGLIANRLIQENLLRISHSQSSWDIPAFPQKIEGPLRLIFTKSLRNSSKMVIDIDALIPGSKHFRWREVLWLRTWEVHIIPTDTQYLNMLSLIKAVENIRSILDVPMLVSSGIRPGIYNKWPKPHGVGGAFYSNHIRGKALDFYSIILTADRIREILLPHLESLGIRMENLPGSSWVHIDNHAPGRSGRFFTP